MKDNVITDYFDAAYCINLDRRTDRWETSKKLFEENNLKVNRFSACDGELIDIRPPYGREIAGTISHCNVLKEAKKLNLNNVLIFEDDVCFESNFQTTFFEVKDQIPQDWDLLYFGGNHTGGFHQISENMFKIFKTYCIHMYAVNSKFFDVAIDFYENKIDNILNKSGDVLPSVGADYFLGILQPNYNCYVIRPHLAFQRHCYSDIQLINVNYDPFLRK